MQNGKAIFVVAPTGLFASRFRAILPQSVDCDTVHAAFNIPVDNEQQPQTNWAISQYDIVIIDEISMVTEKHFQHILATLSRVVHRPILVACGDIGQQQPFEKIEGSSFIVPSPLKKRHSLSTLFIL